MIYTTCLILNEIEKNMENYIIANFFCIFPKSYVPNAYKAKGNGT